jgi:adenylate cyclase
MRPNQFHPERFWSHLGRALYLARRYEDAAAAFKKITAPDHGHHAIMAASLAQMDDATAAGAAADKALAAMPGLTAVGLTGDLPFEHAADREHLIEGLRKAGLPE